MRRRSNAFVIAGDVAVIDIGTDAHPNVTCSISSVDLERVIDGRGRWIPMVKLTGSYVVRRDNRISAPTLVRLHRYLLGIVFQPQVIIDHRDLNGLNNTRENLRIATHTQNNANRGKHLISPTSPFKGVSLEEGRYRARICINGTMINAGSFRDAVTAARAYDAAAVWLFGEFAKPNLRRAA